MRSKTFVFYESEISDLLSESNVKQSDLEHYLEQFDYPEQWIHLFVEWLADQDAEKKS